MTAITFIYKTDDEEVTHTGKMIIENISRNYSLGLDERVSCSVRHILNLWRKKNNMSPVNKMHLGIIGIVNGDWYSKKERGAFSLYIDFSDPIPNCHKYIYNGRKYYYSDNPVISDGED